MSPSLGDSRGAFVICGSAGRVAVVTDGIASSMSPVEYPGGKGVGAPMTATGDGSFAGNFRRLFGIACLADRSKGDAFSSMPSGTSLNDFSVVFEPDLVVLNALLRLFCFAMTGTEFVV